MQSQRIGTVKETVKLLNIKKLKQKSDLILFGTNLSEEERESMVKILVKISEPAYFAT